MEKKVKKQRKENRGRAIGGNEVELIKKILIVIGISGFVMMAIAESGAKCGANEKTWMSAAIIGALLMVLSRTLYSYLNWMRAERARKSIRYRRYLEKENEMSA